MNKRLTKKDIALIKGSLRRVFSRSELRRQVLEAAIVEHADPKRQRVKRWVTCASCKQPEAISLVQVDHIIPVTEINSLTNEYLSWDNVVDRLWCDPMNLQILCKPCHLVKSKLENKLRREYKKKMLK